MDAVKWGCNKLKNEKDLYPSTLVWLGTWKTPHGLILNGFHVWCKQGTWKGVYNSFFRARAEANLCEAWSSNDSLNKLINPRIWGSILRGLLPLFCYVWSKCIKRPVWQKEHDHSPGWHISRVPIFDQRYKITPIELLDYSKQLLQRKLHNMHEHACWASISHIWCHVRPRVNDTSLVGTLPRRSKEWKKMGNDLGKRRKHTDENKPSQ